MFTRAPAVLLVLLVTLAVAAGLFLARDTGGSAARSPGFQRLVGGLGFGPSADLNHCAFGFDPRLCPDCAQDHGPIPAGKYFCPHHASAIFYYRPLAAE